MRTSTIITAFAAFLLSGAAPAAAFELATPGLAPNATVPDKHVFNGFGCTGTNVSPALAWKDAPAGTQSFAVTVYDPDAPTGSGWWHWTLFNLPASTTGLPAGAGDPVKPAVPAGAVQSRTDFGGAGYGGPCPPKGDKPHRYIFTVHALKVDALPLGADASGAMVGYYLGANALAKASLTLTYGR